MLQNTKNEIGRTMVEMLGVLAIVGILSVAGIKGFSMAMNKMRSIAVTELVAEVSMMAQTRNNCLTLSNADDFAAKLDNFEKPACVSKMAGSSSGYVKIIFEDRDECADIERMTGDAFGRCRWVDKENHTYMFYPTRGVNGGECEAVPSAGSCLSSFN